MNQILEVNGLKKDYGSFKLNEISFSLLEGCITGFIGVNGSGKTTTIKTILGLILKDAGTIKLFGKDFNPNDRELKNEIGIVFDEGYFYDDMTLYEMKSIIAPAYSNWDESSFKKYIHRFGLKLHQKIATLSKGMRMKFAITLALSHHAKLLIMDEPTSGLDPLVRSELMVILLEFMENGGKSVFFSTHITSDLDKVADTIILIHQGKILLSEEKDKLLDTHGFVKGDKKLLNVNTRNLFLQIRETEYYFEGITNDKVAVKEQMNGVFIERAKIEDVMLAYIKGESK